MAGIVAGDRYHFQGLREEAIIYAARLYRIRIDEALDHQIRDFEREALKIMNRAAAQ